VVQPVAADERQPAPEDVSEKKKRQRMVSVGVERGSLQV
jgi:hypothetical protein